MKQARHGKTNIIWFRLYTLPRIDKLVETDSRKEGHTVGLEAASVSSDEKVLKTDKWYFYKSYNWKQINDTFINLLTLYICVCVYIHVCICHIYVCVNYIIFILEFTNTNNTLGYNYFKVISRVFNKQYDKSISKRLCCSLLVKVYSVTQVFEDL